MINIIPHLIIRDRDKILLLKRSANHKIWPDHWHCVTGKMEIGETPRTAIIREAKEEIGIDVINPELVTIVSGDQPSIESKGHRFISLEMFFLYNLKEDDNPRNVEPEKHSDITWFNTNELPSKMIGIVKLGVDNYVKKVSYSEYKS